MLGLLEDIFDAVDSFTILVANGLITVVNLFFHGISLLISGLFLLLPELPTATPPPAEWLENANWFYPFGIAASSVATGITLYLGWMAVRYVLRLVRAA